jgi:hypothetical protein
MPYADEIRTLAEIAVALAGFTGIVVALERRSSSAHTGTNRARLRELLLASLGVVFFAFLPTLLAGAGVDDRWAYRASQVPFVAYHVLLMALFFRSASLTQLALTEWLPLPLALGTILLQLATAFGLLSNQLYVVYLLGLLWFLFIACINFVLLLLDDGNAA